MNNLTNVALFAFLSLSSTLAFASPIGGAQHASGALDAYERKPYAISLKGGETWHLTAIGTGEGDLDCYVYDEDDNLVAKDNDDTQTCIISDTPRWSGPFTVVLVNSGSEPILFNVNVR